MAYTSSGWTYTDNNSGYVDLLDNSGEITYSPISGICGGASDYCSISREMDYSIGLVDWTMSQTDSPKVSKTVSGIPCCNQESLVCWFRNDSGVDSSFTGDNKSYSGILTDYGAKIFTRKNVDECNHVMIIGGDPASPTYSGYQFTHGDDFQYFTTGEYYDSGFPQICKNPNHSIGTGCETKYSGTTLGHKIKYLPNTNTISGACIVDNPYLIELYFPNYENDKEHSGFTISAITNGAFSGNTNLSGITLSEVKEIGNNAFKDCHKLSYVDWGNACKQSSLGTIGDNAFELCGFTSLTFPEGVEYIGDYAFSGCTSLTEIGFERSSISHSRHIGDGAFFHCASLSRVTLDKVTSIGNNAFGECESLTSITIPNTVSHIGSGICKTLNEYGHVSRITLSWSTPPTSGIDQNAFNGVASSGTIVVPSDETKPLYESWKANMNGISGWNVDTW